MVSNQKSDRPPLVAHPSAVEFHGLSIRVVDDSEVPGPDTQVYQQEPKRGLFFRKSGRLLTSQETGELVVRARQGLERGAFFELQRQGNVSKQASNLGIVGRKNPVHILDSASYSRYVAMRWLDAEGIHEAVPVYEAGEPVTVSIGSWLGKTVASNEFSVHPTAALDRRVRSVELEDPALAFYAEALQAYQDLPPARP